MWMVGEPGALVGDSLSGVCRTNRADHVAWRASHLLSGVNDTVSGLSSLLGITNDTAGGGRDALLARRG